MRGSRAAPKARMVVPAPEPDTALERGPCYENTLGDRQLQALGGRAPTSNAASTPTRVADPCALPETHRT